MHGTATQHPGRPLHFSMHPAQGCRRCSCSVPPLHPSPSSVAAAPPQVRRCPAPLQLQDVDLRQLHLAVGDRELLADAHLRLMAGTRYGLVGRCGGACRTLVVLRSHTAAISGLQPTCTSPAAWPTRVASIEGGSPALCNLLQEWRGQEYAAQSDGLGPRDRLPQEPALPVRQLSLVVWLGWSPPCCPPVLCMLCMGATAARHRPRSACQLPALVRACRYVKMFTLPCLVHCRYVDQLEGVDPQQTAIQVVVQADTAAQRAQRESEALEASVGKCAGGGGNLTGWLAAGACRRASRGSTPAFL